VQPQEIDMKIRLNELRNIIRSEVRRAMNEMVGMKCKWCGEHEVTDPDLTIKNFEGKEIPACESCYNDPDYNPDLIQNGGEPEMGGPAGYDPEAGHDPETRPFMNSAPRASWYYGEE
jgi:hypothetical protein